MNHPSGPAEPEEIQKKVSERYSVIATQQECGCGCGCGPTSSAESISRAVGYTASELEIIPTGANLGLGCGNPTAIEALRPGEVVVDLGSGAGIDAFIAARQVGDQGRVIGVDMTDAMLEKARDTAERLNYTNVEFRKGRIEALPVEDSTVDVILSNCVINLSPEKDKAFQEAFRVLRPGGRMTISDIVLERPLPEEVRTSIDAYVACVGGASLRSEYLETIARAGFADVEIVSEANYGATFVSDDPETAAAIAAQFNTSVEVLREVAGSVTSLHILARKPQAN